MVHTRRFEPADQAYLSRLAAIAFAPSPTFKYLFPSIAKYPEHFEWNRAQGIRRSGTSPGYVMRVAVADDSDTFTDLTRSSVDGLPLGAWVDGEWVSAKSVSPPENLKVAEGHILGYNKWERTWPSATDTAQQAKIRAAGVWGEDSLIKRINRMLFQLGDKYTEWIGYNQAADHQRIATGLAAAKVELEAIWGPLMEELKRSTGFITCKDVVVDPLFHGRGIGTHMMHWGIQQAEREGVPIVLLASSHGKHLYTKNGFESLGTLTTKGFEHQGPMIYWPKGVKRIETPKPAVKNNLDGKEVEELIT